MKKSLSIICLAIALVMMIMTMSSCIFDSSSSYSEENEKLFIEVVKEFLMPTLEQPETLEITDTKEYVDNNNGILVFVEYAYQTNAGYKEENWIYLVVSTITIDATQITVSASDTNTKELIEKYNGQSVPRGYMSKISLVLNEQNQILNFWQQNQGHCTDSYNKEKVNEGIH